MTKETMKTAVGVRRKDHGKLEFVFEGIPIDVLVRDPVEAALAKLRIDARPHRDDADEAK